MYDATQGAHSGAHISVITKSGTNDLHGMLYEDFQNSVMNAAPFFYNASPAITTKDPFLARNQFGVNIGGPIKKNKLFYFAAYQGVRIADAADATKDVSVPIGLTADRSLQGIVNAVQTSYGKTITTSQVSPVAAAMLQAKLPSGQFLFPSAQITDSTTALALGYDAVTQGPNAATRRGQRGGRHQQHRDSQPEPDLAAARRIHASARLFANPRAVHARRLWHEPARRNQRSSI
jgi:hypothetical protein